MEFFKKKDSIEVYKENGTKVNYFIFKEYEIHLNRVAPHTKQEWHFHSKIEETILINKGELTCYFLENGEKRHYRARESEIIRVGNSVHTFSNEGDESCEFTVFRFVPDGKDKREIIKNDKSYAEGVE